jgi:hypothetical protein
MFRNCDFQIGVRLLDKSMKSSHLAMSSSLFSGIDSMDYVHAQTRGPNWIQLIVNQTIYHLPIPSIDFMLSSPPSTDPTDARVTPINDTISSTPLSSSNTSSSISSVTPSIPTTIGCAAVTVHVCPLSVDVGPVEGSQLAPEWIPLPLSSRLGISLAIQLKWKLHNMNNNSETNRVLTASFAMKRTKHVLTNPINANHDKQRQK